MKKKGSFTIAKKYEKRKQQIPMPSVYPIDIGPKYRYIRTDLLYLIYSHIVYTLFYVVLALGFFRILCGQKIIGKKNLHSLKKKGFITVANHCHFFDTVMTASAVHPRRPWFASVQRNFEAPYFRKMFRSLRGFPIPAKAMGLKMILKPVKKAINDGKIVHFFPEEELWHLCQDIAYFHKGSFYLAHQANCPVVPIIHLFKERTFFGRKISPNWIKLTTVIGEPIFPTSPRTKEKGTDKSSVSEMTQKAQVWMEEQLNAYKEEKL